MIGDRLVHVRAQRSQRAMAELLGISLRTYAYYEQNHRVPDADTLAVLVRNGWNANWLLTGEGPERQPDQAAPSAAPTLDAAALAHATSILLGVLNDTGTDLTHADFGAAVLDIYTAMRTGGRQALTQAVATAAARAQKQNG